MARRGRKASLSPQQAQQRKDAKTAQKAQAKASNALAKLPAEVERRNEFWHQLEALEAKGQAVNGEKSEHIKRMHEVFGITKQAMRIRKILVGCPDGDYEATVEQIMLFMRDYNRPIQIDMFKLEPGKGVAEDEGAVFDSTGAGERQAAERVDDSARARKAPAPVPVPNGPTPVVSMEEAERLFRERQHLAPKVAESNRPPTEEEVAAKEARIAAQKAQDAQEFEEAPDPANDAEAATEAPKRRGRPPMTEEQKAAAKAERLATKGKPAPAKEVKAKADKYVAEQEERMNGGPPPAPSEEEDLERAPTSPLEGADAPGSYQLN